MTIENKNSKTTQTIKQKIASTVLYTDKLHKNCIILLLHFAHMPQKTDIPFNKTV